MRTLVCTSPGFFEYSDNPVPASRPGYSIVKIRHIGICGTDLHAYEGTQPYFDYPRILGHELSAELVESNDAPGFENGESVTILPYFSCGHCIACRNGKPNCCTTIKVCGVHIDGGMAEYLSVPSGCLIHGEGLPDQHLAIVEPLAIGAHGIRRAGMEPGEYVLVAGAGPIGIAAMEFARLAGGKVIAMDVNPFRLSFCIDKKHAEYIVNAKQDNTRDQLLEITNGDMPTVVIDATGNRNAINNGINYLAHGGRYVLIGLQKGDLEFSHPEFHKREATLMSSRNATIQDFEQVIGCISKGLIRPSDYISNTILFENTADAFPGLLDPSANIIKTVIEMT